MSGEAFARVAEAIARERAGQFKTPPARPHHSPMVSGRAAEMARLAAAILLGLMIGATTVLAGSEAGSWLLACVAMTTKYMGEIVRTIAFAALGFIAGLAKALQAYADGKVQSPRIVAANLGVSMVFGVLGGVGADGFGLDPKLGFCVAFVFGVMTFGSMRIIEDRLRK